MNWKLIRNEADARLFINQNVAFQTNISHYGYDPRDELLVTAGAWWSLPHQQQGDRTFFGHVCSWPDPKPKTALLVLLGPESVHKSRLLTDSTISEQIGNPNNATDKKGFIQMRRATQGEITAMQCAVRSHRAVMEFKSRVFANGLGLHDREFKDQLNFP